MNFPARGRLNLEEAAAKVLLADSFARPALGHQPVLVPFRLEATKSWPNRFLLVHKIKI